MIETQFALKSRAKTGPKGIQADWEGIKLARVQGHDRVSVAAKYGVKAETIKKREQRESWPLLDKVRRELSQTVNKAVPRGLTVPKSESGEGVRAMTEANLAQIALTHPMIMAEYMAKKRDEMLAKDLLKAPESWKEAATMDSIMRKAAGLDRPQTQVQVNLWQGSSQSQAHVQTFDLDSD